MFSVRNTLLYFQERPLFSLDPNTAIAASGCGKTAFYGMSDGALHLRDSIRMQPYYPRTPWVTEKEAHIVLAAKGSEGLSLQCTASGDTCTICLVGLPWDHNRFWVYLTALKDEHVYSGFDGTDARPWLPGEHAYWADKKQMSPQNGFHCENRLQVSIQTAALTRFFIHHKGYHRIESWDRDACIIVAQNEDAKGPAITEGISLPCTVVNGGFTAIEKQVLLSQSQRNDARVLRQGQRNDASVLRQGQKNDTETFKEARRNDAEGPRKGQKIEKKVILAARGNDAGDLQEDKKNMSDLVLIDDWQGAPVKLLGRSRLCTWRPDIDQYPDLKNSLQKLRLHQVRCLGNVFPLVDVDTAIFQEAEVRGYLLCNSHGRTFIDKTRETPAAWVDLSLDRAVAWIQEWVRKVRDTYGFDEMIAELDSPFPIQAVGEGGSAIFLRNTWESLWQRICREAQV